MQPLMRRGRVTSISRTSILGKIFVKLDMDISDIFEIYNIKKIGDDGQALVTQCTTEYNSGGVGFEFR